MSTQADFTYNASALGLGGAFTRNGQRIVVPSIASVALSPTGGNGAAVVEGYNRDGVSFSSAISTVAGFESGTKVYTTDVSIRITDLSLFGQLRIALLTADITSTRDLNSARAESTFRLRATYHGVQIADGELIPLVDVSLGELPTYDDYVQRLVASPSISAAGEEELQKFNAAVGRREPLTTSIVTGVDERRPAGALTAATRHGGNAVPVAGLGKVHFGELIVKPGRRRVNLLRVRFGDDGGVTFDHSSDSGSLTVGSGDGNGAPVWPRG